MLLNLEPDEELEDNSNQSALIKQSVTMLYRLAQNPYILINHGTTQMLVKYQKEDFGYCPMYTENKPMSLIGLSNTQMRPW